MCSSTQHLEGHHAFLFSLRSLSTSAKKRFDITLDFCSKDGNQCLGSGDDDKAKPDIFNLSSLLPCFSKGS